MAKTERIHTSGSLVWLSVGDLELAPSTWGRPLRGADVRQIGAELDPDLFGIPVVWERPERDVGAGRYIIIDGQHRVHAVVRVCGWVTEQIQCQVFRDIDDAEAARISLGHQERRNLHPFDRWRAARAAGVPSAVAIDKAAANAGLTITRTAQHNSEICAVGTMAKCWERLTTPGLTRLLVILASAWEATPASFSGPMLRVGMILLANYDGAIDDGRMARTLGAHAPGVWLSQTTPKKKHLGYIAQDVVTLYNTGLRSNRLDDHRSPDDYVNMARRPSGSSGPRPKIDGRRTTATSVQRVRREAARAKKP